MQIHLGGLAGSTADQADGSVQRNQDTSYKGKRAIRAIIRVGWSNGVLVSMLQLLSLIFLLKGYGTIFIDPRTLAQS